MSIAEKIEAVRLRMEKAARRAGRRPEEIALMAVTKTVDAARIREARAAGIRIFGENRVQEFALKHEALRGLEGAEWHLIGHLQSNKAGKAAELFDAVDSLDSLKLAKKLSESAQSMDRSLDVLLEINLGDEAAKSGLAPDSEELESILAAAPELEGIRIRGLMAIPPFHDDPNSMRPYFSALRKLRQKLAARSLPGVSMETLSMGMTHDFEIAIEEGATCVRVGAAIFGPRTKA